MKLLKASGRLLEASGMLSGMLSRIALLDCWLGWLSRVALLECSPGLLCWIAFLGRFGSLLPLWGLALESF